MNYRGEFNSMNKNNNKRNIIILISMLLMFGMRFVPALPSLSASGMQVLGIFAGTLLLWLTIAIDWPSILLIGALAFVPELKIGTILSSAYGGTIFVFLMFTFVVTYTLSKTSYIKRIALLFIHSKLAMKGPWMFVTLYFASILVIGSFISPTVLFFVYLPILEEIYALLELKKGDKLASVLMMGTVIMCGISSGMTPIAHVFPVIAMNAYTELYGTVIHYGSYMLAAIPVGILTAIVALLLFRYVVKPDTSSFAKFEAKKINLENDKPTRSENLVLAIFILVVCMWVLPNLCMHIIKEGPIFDGLKYLDKLGTAFPPLVGIVLLSVITDEGKPLLNFGEAMSKGVSWPSLIMCAGTTALGAAITNSDIGVTAWISGGLSPITSHLPVMIMVFIFILWAAIQTNLSSNIVTATVVSAAALAVTASITTVNVGALIVNIGMMSAFAFATPPAMPCVAIAVSSGWTNTKQMMVYGFIIMIAAVFLSTCIGYPIAAALL